jgi:tripartite-type tricarboxylate transporter receptor subunit TctC
MTIRRRQILLAASSMAAWPGTRANAYPDKPVRLILPFPAGSTSDLLARYMGDKVTKKLGQPLVVESKPGAQGAIAARFVARSRADGYTILFGTNSTHAANPFLIKNLGYDPIKDFAPLTQCSVNPLLLVINADLPVRSVAELVQHARAHPGKLSYGAGNTGSLVSTQLLRSVTGIDALAVNYPGVAQATNDLVAGRLDFMLVDPSVIRPFVESGKVRVLGVSSRERLPSWPDAAPLAELGVPGYDYASWSGLFAPAGTPDAVLQTLSRAFDEVLQEEESEKFLSGLGMIVKRSSPPAFAAFVKSQIGVWEKLIRDAGLTVG